MHSFLQRSSKELFTIAIVPIGTVDSAVLEFLRKRLEEIFVKTRCHIVNSLPLPKNFFDARRGQYYSTGILTDLVSVAKEISADRVLGVVEADLYVPRLNFVFGEAQSLGTVALISTHRLKPGFYGNREDNQLLFGRTAKEAVHELGHTMGLSHCSDPKCVMYFSNTITDTDRKGEWFCLSCEKKVERVLGERKI